MDTDTKELTFQQRSVVATLKDNAAYIDGCIDTIERKAHQNFATVNIIAAIVGVVNLTSVASPAIRSAVAENPISILIYSPTALIVVAYFLALRTQNQAGQMARRMSHPIDATEESVKWWEDCSVKEYYDQTVKHYIKAYKHNNCLNERKAEKNKCIEDCLRWSVRLAFGQLGLCIIAACTL